ncbi:hypothetical protein ACSMXN_05005 [Jatrophihabitans sp. DSM 45814]
MSVPSVFGLPHLSEDAVAAFADGVLAPAAASRAARHCAECRECADAVRGQRETAMMLRSAAAPSLPTGLLDRLAGLPMSAPLPPSRGLPTTLGADGVPVFVSFSANSGMTATIGDPRGSSEPDADESSGRSDQAAQSVQASTAVQSPPAAADGPTEPRASTSGRGGHNPFRRAALPMGLIASAAAVVAVGTLSGQVQSLANNGRQDAPAASIVGAVHTSRAPASGVPAFQTVRSTSSTSSNSVPAAGATSTAAGAFFSATAAFSSLAAHPNAPAPFLHPGFGLPSASASPTATPSSP